MAARLSAARRSRASNDRSPLIPMSLWLPSIFSFRLLPFSFLAFSFSFSTLLGGASWRRWRRRWWNCSSFSLCPRGRLCCGCALRRSLYKAFLPLLLTEPSVPWFRARGRSLARGSGATHRTWPFRQLELHTPFLARLRSCPQSRRASLRSR